MLHCPLCNHTTKSSEKNARRHVRSQHTMWAELVPEPERIQSCQEDTVRLCCASPPKPSCGMFGHCCLPAAAASRDLKDASFSMARLPSTLGCACVQSIPMVPSRRVNNQRSTPGEQVCCDARSRPPSLSVAIAALSQLP
jgi:hypothetical protein